MNPPALTGQSSGTAPLADQDARDRIQRELDTCFLVEAGAGSGKTTSLVGRLLSHVLRGTPVEQLAAVTFTRKAAGELRERFQMRLEQELATARAGRDARGIALLDRALLDLDRAFLGTIHAFCGRLLRERPLEAGLDPSFSELTQDDAAILGSQFWDRWIERCRRTDDPDSAALRALGIEPRGLREPFADVVRYGDTDFTGHATETPCPDHRPCRAELERLLAHARERMPTTEPDGGWDALQETVQGLAFSARISDWSMAPQFAEAIADLSKGACAVVQKKWSADTAGKAAAKELGEAVTEWYTTTRHDWLQRWYEHRYPTVLRFLTRAAAEFAQERRATGQLSFEDLLAHAARLLRTSDRARADLGTRYRYLLVDEFQDTDPVQAEVCFLLASEPAQGTNWTTVIPRPGALFVVGDPKQSIYRFRRADIETYNTVKARLADCGDVLALTTNFRSVPAIAGFVNEHFARAGSFGAETTPQQAAFSPMIPAVPVRETPAVSRYALSSGARQNAESLVSTDAANIARWIAGRVEKQERAPGDFLILTYQTRHVGMYARALAEYNVPATTTGATLPQELELRELVATLRLLADPDNTVLAAAVLQGAFFGCSPAELLHAKLAGMYFIVTRPPEHADTRVGASLRTLNAWWSASQQLPADAVLERLLDDTGLLPYAASLDLGDARAGALLHLVERVRGAADVGGMAGAIETIERALDAKDSADAPLRPGRSDAVRVMNLHKAKGLEAPVVILAAPVPRPQFPPSLHVTRDGNGRATGGLHITMKVRGTHRTIAQPIGWDAMERTEAEFLTAEWVRLLYVAATRAKHELVIGQLDARKADGSPASMTGVWQELDAVLGTHAAPLVFTVDREPPGRRALERPMAEVVSRAADAELRRAGAGRVSHTTRTVTEEAKEQSSAAERTVDRRRHRVVGSARGKAWGSAVHRLLEAAGRGRSGDGLAAFARAVVRDEGLVGPGEDAGAEAAPLIALVAQVRASAEWASLSGAEERRFELPVAACERESAGAPDGSDLVRVLEGVLDAAARIDGQWTVLDWKSDNVDDTTWAMRRPQYEQQVALYASMLETAGLGVTIGRIVRARGGAHE